MKNNIGVYLNLRFYDANSVSVGENLTMRIRGRDFEVGTVVDVDKRNNGVYYLIRTSREGYRSFVEAMGEFFLIPALNAGRSKISLKDKIEELEEVSV